MEGEKQYKKSGDSTGEEKKLRNSATGESFMTATVTWDVKGEEKEGLWPGLWLYLFWGSMTIPQAKEKAP